MRRAAIIAVGSVAAGCSDGGAILVLALFVFAAVAGLREISRQILDPGRHDPSARAMAEVAARLGLPAPRGATRLAWPLPSGLEAQASASDALEVVVPLSHLPRSVAVERPKLPPGVGLSQVHLPPGVLDGFDVRGPEPAALGLLAAPVRAALSAADAPRMRIAIERGAVRVRLGRDQANAVDEAATRAEAVAQPLVRLPTGELERLAAIALDVTEPAPLRQRVLQALLAHHPEARRTVEVAGALVEDPAIDPEQIRRWRGRHGGGALSLSSADGEQGALGLPDEGGRLSEPPASED